ncbi:N(4)-(beta-N-acetylglucosaminyl)-L-asparaginase [Shewanella submarina]|uniref:N(4)-(Beta-N-acetylglucosaminyl)-L-asparaginase n=1 Tax=Shewanella submarina TaxID=2016376 RepID=A0ABV7G8Z1_9GAMM|nr:N(4)-(beta-N-acetylglucosaminyl)-L-asparaginase [Shewanella submarina]MCL1036807.1 N(4)-(beta-N-acetylglucosaminyl)-L-asparaginase [Shewanella submarina]
MTSRREFISGALAMGVTGIPESLGSTLNRNTRQAQVTPVVVSTWDHGLAANQAAWELLNQGGYSLDAVEAGVRVSEADPGVRTVGLGGYPDASGEVTLDACIMNEKMDCGSVAFLQEIKHPISVARAVMERTPHVMLVGQGAQDFALTQGFAKENLLTPQAYKDWQVWRAQGERPKDINIENHDTIGMLALDKDGRLSGACTTSGAAYKLHGRVGDSPIIGAGLYVDGAVGGAVATGMGELMMKTLGCFLVVELMRQGATPMQACKGAVLRIAEKLGDFAAFQVGFVALDCLGESASYCIQPGFSYARHDKQGAILTKSEALLGEAP